MAQVALAEADALGAASFDLFGHSMGGRVALEVLRQAPERVRRLALVSTGVHPLGASEPEKRHAPAHRMAEQVEARGSKRIGLGERHLCHRGQRIGTVIGIHRMRGGEGGRLRREGARVADQPWEEK
jgi:pimeloyl-ACP methyl ester carboxylesterase